MAIEKNSVFSGKRKTAIAKATIKAGEGRVIINKKPLEFFPELQQLELKEPIIIAKNILGEIKFDVVVNVHGGGRASRVEASRLVIARAIVGFTKNENLRKAYLDYDRNMLIADTRRKEAYKPGDSKARAKRQSSKR